MIISYNWLKKYFKTLPAPYEVALAFSSHLTEVENVEQKGEDTVMDVKVLSDRNCYAQSHRGLAYDLSAILDLPTKSQENFLYTESSLIGLEIKVEEKSQCNRYIGRRIENVEVRESAPRLKEKLENIGQKSINNIVDTLNYTMFDIGQPLHAFDADLVEGKIIIRFAKKGESITTLDNKEVELDPGILVIADEKAPLAIAGIKGGKRAEVTKMTKNIIIESANFNKSTVRRTSTRINLKTDASKRFENGLATEFCDLGMEAATSYIAKFNPDVKIGVKIDIDLSKQQPSEIITSVNFINDLIGMEISEKEILNILERLGVEIQKNGNDLILRPPFERLDLNIPEDIVEEVARIYGYEKIKSTPLQKKTNLHRESRNFIWIENIKDILMEIGFSEIMTHTLVSRGEIEIEKPVAEDKNFARSCLSDNIQKSLTLNLHNAPLLGLSQIKIFEIGRVFKSPSNGGEHTSLCIGVANTKSHKGPKANETIKEVREELLSRVNANVQSLCTLDDSGGILMLKGKPIGKINELDGVMELNLDMLIDTLPDPSQDFKSKFSSKKYIQISTYPFVLRDIAVFVPGESGRENDVHKIIRQNGTDLLIRADLFDIFTRLADGGQAKTSYAFKLVFQSSKETLTDEDVNKIMAKIEAKMKDSGYEVR